MELKELLEKGEYTLSELSKELDINKDKIKKVMKKLNNVEKKEIDNNTYYYIAKKIAKKKDYTLFFIALIFVLSIILRIINLEKPYVTWDEHANMYSGIQQVTALLNIDYDSDVWTDSNIVYYDHPPLGKYFYGLISIICKKITQNSSYLNLIYWSRTMSAILGSITCIIVFLIGKKIHSNKAGIISALLLSFSPTFIAYTKLSTLESSYLLFFTLAIYGYLRMNKKNIILIGILCGLAISTRMNGIFVIPLLSAMLSLNSNKKYLINFKEKQVNIGFFLDFFKYCFILLTIALLTLIIIWPYLWHDLVNNLMKTLSNTNRRSGFSFMWSIELMINFFTKTPLLLILLAIYSVIKKREKILLLWLLLPFISFLNTNIFRYILVTIIPLSLMAGIGASYLSKKIYIPLIIYMLLNVFFIHPFYLSYYNELTGFSVGAYAINYLKVGIWGEGVGEAVEYVNKIAEQNSSVQLFLMPNPSYYPLRSDLKLVYPSTNLSGDYVLMNVLCYSGEIAYDWSNNITPNITTQKIEESGYSLLYEIKAMGAPLAKIYKKD
ncbi:MAG: glycosyltransferase family 39 protein [Candidatus Nanoarchaeia archaeon]|jgi:4-amino-4-deoxy-L-arabinose transferase-like glycosyltransferase